MKTKLLIYLCALACVCGACKKDKDNERISPVQSISFDSETYSMNEGEKLYLSGELTIMPTAVADTATVTWSSSDESIATVSEYGTVTAQRVGTVEICAESNHKKATCTVTVNRIPVTKLMVPKKLRLPQNKWKEIPIVVEPENASLSSVRVNMYHDESGVYNAMQKVEYREGSWWMYSSSRSGVVYQLDVVSDDSGDSIHAVVEVYSILATKIEFTESTYKVGIGQTHPTELIYTPDSVSYKTAFYTSSDESIATVDENGVVTGVAEGMATITATSNGLETSCTVTVGNFVYKPVEKITSSLEHLWMTNDLEGITLPKGVFTVSPADATKPEVNLSVEGTASTYLQVARTADGWTLTPTKRTKDWYKGELVAKADGKEVRVPLILLEKSTILGVANAYVKYVTSYPFGYAERISLGQEIPKEFGNHMKVQLLSIENTGNQYSPQKAFDITNGTPIGTGQYITGPVSVVVAYSHVYNNTEYNRYHNHSMDYFGTTIYNWRITLDGIYGEESKVYSHDYQQVFRSGFSHYKMTISSPSKVYCVGSSQTTDAPSGGTEYVTTYSRHNYYPSSDYFVLTMPNSNPEFIGDAGPITISVQAFADHQEQYGTPVVKKTYTNGTAFMQEINNCISQSKKLEIGTFGTSNKELEYHDVNLKFRIWDRYESIDLEWQGRDKFYYYFPLQ